MLPGWTAEQLLAAPTPDVATAESSGPPSLGGGGQASTPVPPSPGMERRHADATRVFSSRAEFMAKVSPVELFEQAQQIRAAGLSLNMLCQQFADQRLKQLVEHGARIQALFLDPDGKAIRAREIEEGITAGHLSTLTKLNIDLLLRVRAEVDGDSGSNVQVGVYDETIRFNVTLVDDELCVAQPYLPAMRGVESPTLVIQRNQDGHGLFDTFEQVFNWTAERSTPL